MTSDETWYFYNIYISMFLFVDAVGEGRGSRLVHQLQDVQPRDPDNTVKKWLNDTISALFFDFFLMF